jgi:hypothetical protein
VSGSKVKTSSESSVNRRTFVPSERTMPFLPLCHNGGDMGQTPSKQNTTHGLNLFGIAGILLKERWQDTPPEKSSNLFAAKVWRKANLYRNWPYFMYE